MADDATAAPSSDAPAAAPTTIEKPTTSSAPAADIPEAPITKEDEEVAGERATTKVNAPDGDGAAEAAIGPSSAAAPEAKTPSKGNTSGAAGSKSQKGKRKSLPVMQLECEPGEYYLAKVKGYSAWPAIVCDEQMLPESLLATRPVSAARPDGNLRDDFRPGGKNAKDRTFPIMFLHTNEFAWVINTSLTPLDPKECENPPTSKMSKSLQSAYKVAAEAHDLEYFKGILKSWQEETAQMEQEAIEQEEREAREEEERKVSANGEDGKGKKKKARKSKGGDGDVEMEDAEAPKSSKKRKKELESDADNAQPKKTPKVTKINAPKTPSGDSTVKKSAKSKKKLVTAPKEEEEEKPQMTEEERMAQREKTVLYLRHRLQKGFLSRDHAPLESEMSTMADLFKQLETHDNLEPSIIRTTKIHKVLKAIVKLSSIPKDEEFHFKKRSSAMLEIWNRRLEADGGQAAPSATEPKTASPDPKAEAAPVTNGTKEPADADTTGKEGAAEDNAATSTAAEPQVNGEASEATANKTDAPQTTLVTDSHKHDTEMVDAEPTVETRA